jgi:hypothetical protein
LPGDPPTPIEAQIEATAQRPTDSSASVVAEEVHLDKEAEREGLSVVDQIAPQNAEQRRAIAARMVQTFLAANVLTLLGVAVLVLLDEFNLLSKLASAGDRIITHQVIIGLLAATTVQVGAITVIVARYLFPGRSRDA